MTELAGRIADHRRPNGITSRLEPVRRVGVLILDAFCLSEFALVVDTLRTANEVAGAQRYAVTVTSIDEDMVCSATGLPVRPDALLSEIDGLDELVIVGHGRGTGTASSRMIAKLHAAANQGSVVWGLSNSVFLLAQARLLRSDPCAVHWLYHDAFREAFPGIDTTTQLFHMGRRVITCVGGAATLDLVVARIAAQQGWPLAVAVLDRLVCEHPRSGENRHQFAFRRLLRSASTALARIVDMMEKNLSEPLSSETIAQAVSLSRRQVERLFRTYLDRTPQTFYRELRLARAHDLLLYSNLTVTEVAIATGFESPSNFTRVFREKFDYCPSRVRRRHISHHQPMPTTAIHNTPSIADALLPYLSR
jgi:transcriptional regulator GlxA family with amidase domain